jgi:hypothetical protein
MTKPKIKLTKKEIVALAKAIATVFKAKTLTDEQKEKEMISQLNTVCEGKLTWKD